MLCNGFNLAMSSPRDRRGSKARICIFFIKGKMTRFNHIAWFYSVSIMSSCLRHYSVCHELNTIDAAGSRSIGEAIVVDEGRSWSTSHGCDAYIRDHCHE